MEGEADVEVGVGGRGDIKGAAFCLQSQSSPSTRRREFVAARLLALRRGAGLRNNTEDEVNLLNSTLSYPTR